MNYFYYGTVYKGDISQDVFGVTMSQEAISPDILLKKITEIVLKDREGYILVIKQLNNI
jgi:hypothetical protein